MKSGEMDFLTGQESWQHVLDRGQGAGSTLYYKGQHPTPTHKYLAQKVNTVSLRSPDLEAPWIQEGEWLIAKQPSSVQSMTWTGIAGVHPCHPKDCD